MNDPDYFDHDPLAPSAEERERAENNLAAAIYSTSPEHSDGDYLRRFQPLDLRTVKDA